MDPHYQPYTENNLQKPADANSYTYNTAETTYVTTITTQQTMEQQWAGNQFQDPNQTTFVQVDGAYQPNVVVTQDNQSYILQQDPNTPYITEHQTMETQEQQLYTVAQDGQQATYVYQQAHIQENFGGQVTTEAHYVQQEFSVENPQIQSENAPADQQLPAAGDSQATEVQIEEIPDSEPVPQEAEVVEPITEGIVVNVTQPDDEPPPVESTVDENGANNPDNAVAVEVSEVVDESEMEGAEVIEDAPQTVQENETTETEQNIPMETDADLSAEEIPTEDASQSEASEEVAAVDVNPPDTKISEISNEEPDGTNSMEVTEQKVEEIQEISTDFNHTSPEQALGAMYEFNEESEGHINTSLGKTMEMDPLATMEDEPQAKVVESVLQKKGRKQRDVPTFITGVDLSNPAENLLNGKSAPKPRLGVKVPTRNLTSHIVSKAEIEQEILERNRKKMEAKGEEAFSKKLTQRLAKQIGVNSKAGSSSNGTDESENKSLIENNSDLLAILEGDDSAEMPVLQKGDVGHASEDPQDIKKLEREIALQQLKELPYCGPKSKYDLNKKIPGFAEPPKLHPENRKEDKKPKKKQQESPEKSTTASPDKNYVNSSSEIEPQIKVNMALKTYSRKRKSLEAPEATPEKKAAIVPPLIEPPVAPAPLSPARIDCPITTAAYVTKSSRVIKKKVIWDPDDELPSVVARSTKTTLKNETPPESPTNKPTKTEKTTPVKVDKSTETPKLVEKKVEKTPIKEKVIKKDGKTDESTPKKEKAKAKEKSVEKIKLSPKKLTPPPKKKTPKAKKSMSEVDRLLGDEGAIRMLYEMKNEDGTEEKGRKSKRNIISVEKTFKELAKQADEIKSSLVNSTNSESSPPKTLRRKDTSSPAPPPPPPPATIEKPEKKQSATLTPKPAPVLNRQKSKDSSRSSVHTPPASPAPSFEAASYLIRRRSSSSISDLQDDEFINDDDSDVEIKIPRRKTTSISSSSDVPKVKKYKKLPPKQETANSTIESETEVSPAKAVKFDNRLGSFTKLSVKKVNKQVTLTLKLESTKGYLTIEVLEEFTSALSKLSKERDCNVVLVRSSQEKVFCLGLDYKYLIDEKESERKVKASKLASCVSDFIKALLHFPKVLVVGIQGECVGLGVTMLPLFDLVVASDKSRFSTNYSALGCVAEAGFLLTPPHITNHGLASELLYSNVKLTADDAQRRGLVSKLCWPEKYQETIRNLTGSISKGSKQSLESTKKQLKKGTFKSTESAVDSMTKQLVDHWSSNECQKNFYKIDNVDVAAK